MCERDLTLAVLLLDAGTLLGLYAPAVINYLYVCNLAGQWAHTTWPWRRLMRSK
jgi:hypothetical protein